MRVLRGLISGLIGLVLTFGSVTFLGGCTDVSNTDGTQVKVDETEQKQLQDAIQKGLHKKAVAKSKKPAR
jgi:hypothetical protein